MIKRRMSNPDVSFVNLIDVTMVLLIIFMITAPAIQDYIPVDLPSARRSPTANITEGIILTVDNKGSVFIDDDRVATAEFENRFSEIVKERAGEPVFIRGDKEVSYGYVLEVFSIAKDLGVESVSLVVEERTVPRRR